MSIPSSIWLRTRARGPLVAGVVAFSASLFVPLGLDEAAWSAVADVWFGGGRLYVDAIDNKTPIIYALTGLVERLPGQLPLGRSVVVGVCVGVLWWGITKVLGGFVAERSARGIAAGAVVATAWTASFGLMTTELLGFTLIVVALAWTRDGAGNLWPATLCALAPAVDPRFAVLLPALAWWIGGRSQSRSRVWIGVGAIAALGLLTVLAVPDFRYALVELNTGGSRTTVVEPARQLAAMIRALLPAVVVLAILRVGKPAGVVVALAVPAVAVAWLSFRPFDHYWVLTLPAVVMWTRQAKPPAIPAVRAVALVIASLVPLATEAVSHHQMTAAERGDYESITPIVAASLGAEDTYVAFDNRPWLPYVMPERNGLRSPLHIYLSVPTSRQADALADVEERFATGQIGVLISDGGLEVPYEQVLVEARPLRRVIDRYIAEFSCVLPVHEDITIYVRAPSCP